MIRRPRTKDEQGQAIVLLAIALVGLLGFAALALDGGNLYTEQRRAQAAADNAVMAAAYSQMKNISDTATLRTVALANAKENLYDNNGANNWVSFHRPPIHGPYAGNRNFMEVVITQTVSTALAHIVYRQSPIPLTVFAVAHGVPSQPMMINYALAAMKPNCDGESTISMQGRGTGSSGGTYLVDGGAFSNSTCPDAMEMSGSHAEFKTDGPAIDVVGGAEGSTCSSPEQNTGCNYYPGPNTGVQPHEQDPIKNTPAATPPNCNALPARDINTELAGDNIIEPGRYTSLDSGSRDFHMNPGIYCLSNGTLTAGNGSITGDGVMIYLMNTAAEINFSGNGSLNITAPTVSNTPDCTGTDDEDPSICRYLGILVYKLVGANSCSQSDVEIDFTGSGSMNVRGLVYAPYSLVRYGGNGTLTMTGQSIVGCVKFNGNGRIDIVYNPSLTYVTPPIIRLDE